MHPRHLESLGPPNDTASYIPSQPLTTAPMTALPMPQCHVHSTPGKLRGDEVDPDLGIDGGLSGGKCNMVFPFSDAAGMRSTLRDTISQSHQTESTRPYPQSFPIPANE